MLSLVYRLERGRRIPIAGILLGVVVACCLVAGCISGPMPGSPESTDGGVGSQQRDAGWLSGGVAKGGEYCCEHVPGAALEPFIPPPEANWKVDNPLRSFNTNNPLACQSIAFVRYLCDTCKYDRDGNPDYDWIEIIIFDMGKGDWGMLGPYPTPLPDQCKDADWPQRQKIIKNRFVVCASGRGDAKQYQVDMYFNKIDFDGIGTLSDSGTVIKSCEGVMETPCPPDINEQESKNPKCKAQKDNLVFKMMVRNAFSSSALHDLAFENQADGNQYYQAAGKFGTLMRDNLNKIPDDSSTCRSDFDRTVEIYNQMSSGSGSSFVDSVFQNSRNELVNALTADLTQPNPQGQGQGVGLPVGGEVDEDCKVISNPTGDPAVNAHESAHLEYCRTHGTLKETAEVSGEGSLLDYIQGSETYAYDAEINYLMGQLRGSGC